MKFNKNNFQIIMLLVAAIGIILSMFAMISDMHIFNTIDDSAILFVATITIFVLTIYTSVLTIVQRVNPKKKIFLSYSSDQKDVADIIVLEMREQFKRASKYKFELFTADTVPYGCDMRATVKSYIKETDIIIIIVSQRYVNSDWCRNEFSSLIETGKKIIPIVTDSFDDLSQLPVNISNIKALSLIGMESQKEIKEQLSKLVFDLIRQRKFE